MKQIAIFHYSLFAQYPVTGGSTLLITLFKYSNNLLLNVFVEMLILQYGTTQMSNCLRFREYKKVSDVDFWSKCEEKEKKHRAQRESLKMAVTKDK